MQINEIKLPFLILFNSSNSSGYHSYWRISCDFAFPFREKFLEAVKKFKPEELSSIEIIRSEKGQRRKLGDYLLRIAYHESVHTGQMLAYLRELRLERPLIWD